MNNKITAHTNGDAALKSKLLIVAAALAILAVFAIEFLAIKSGDAPGTKCELTPMGGTPGTYAVSCAPMRP